jgi:hypothetical protein
MVPCQYVWISPSSGSTYGGDIVDIYGGSFDADSYVSLNSGLLNLVFINDHHLQGTVPPSIFSGPTDLELLGDLSGGLYNCSLVSSGAFNYVAPPPGGGCGRGLTYTVEFMMPTEPDIYAFIGNLNGCTPPNVAGGTGYAYPGFVPDASVDFVVYDYDMGGGTWLNPFTFRLSFEQISSSGPAQWNYYVNDVSGGQAPNSQAWVAGGPGNLVASGGPLKFNADGSLQDNGNSGNPILLSLAVTDGAVSPFQTDLFFGTDAVTDPSGLGERDGLTGDECCVLGSRTPTRSITATSTVTPSSSFTVTLAAGSTTATPTMTATPSSSLSPTFSPVLSASAVSLPVVPAGSSSIYPSPATGSTAHVAFEMLQAGQAHIVIYDSGGNVASTVTENLPAGAASVSVDISALLQGVYFYRIDLTFSDGTQQRPTGGRFAVIH